MEVLGLRRRGIGWRMAAAVLTCAVLFSLPEVSSIRYIVGGNMGWSSNVNYTIWAQDKHFYPGDWLFFVYDRDQMTVLEVNKTNYDRCNYNHPLHNWTTGAGRDVVPLNVTKTYYFISGNEFCYRGMKLTVHVENPQKSSSPSLPPSPSSLPQKSSSPSLPPSPVSSLPQKSSSPSLSPLPSSLPPTQSSLSSGSPSLPNTLGGQILVPTLSVAFLVGDFFLLL